MKIFVFLATAAAVGMAAAPAAAQTAYPYPQAYPQPYPQAYPQGYPQPGYAQGYAQPGYAQQAYPGYGQQAYPGYGQQPSGQNVVGQMINQLLGNRYSVNDRTAVTQCANAAMAQAAARYRGNSAYAPAYGRYNQGHGYNQVAPAMRVTAITDVQRRSNSVRVSGLMSSGMNAQGYRQGYGQQGYADPRYAAAADLSFRCNVDHRGAVTNVRLGRNTAYRG